MKRPTWKSRYSRTRPRRPVSRCPGLEPLERRHLLSVALAEIDSTLPADGTALLASPQQFAINFDPATVNEIDDLFSGLFGTTPAQTFPAIIALDNDTSGDNDEFAIDQVGPGGVTTPLLGGDHLSRALARSDHDGDRRRRDDDPVPVDHHAGGRVSAAAAGDLPARHPAGDLARRRLQLHRPVTGLDLEPTDRDRAVYHPGPGEDARRRDQRWGTSARRR